MNIIEKQYMTALEVKDKQIRDLEKEIDRLRSYAFSLVLQCIKNHRKIGV